MIQILRECFPQFNGGLDDLPDPRRQDLCRYSGAHLWWHIFSSLTPERVIGITRAGRERHRIEDMFNAQKNHGIGLEHIFCAETTAAKNYYTMMQVAQILWNLVCHGYLRRVYAWARRATEQGLARAVWEGLRAWRLPPDLPPIGQVRFGYP